MIAKLNMPEQDRNVLSQPRSGLHVRLSNENSDRAAAYLENNQPERAVEVATAGLSASSDDPRSLLLAFRTFCASVEFLRRTGKNREAKQDEAACVRRARAIDHTGTRRPITHRRLSQASLQAPGRLDGSRAGRVAVTKGNDPDRAVGTARSWRAARTPITTNTP